MKKISTLLVGLAICSLSFGQAVADNALIPVSITLNSILRMNVTSGGNINFNVNTLDQYEDGISNSAAYTTTFTVASSTHFKVGLYAEDASFMGSDLSTNLMPLNLVGYQILCNGGHKATNATPEIIQLPADGVIAPLTATAVEIIKPGAVASGGNSGDISDNDFSILWELGTAGVIASTGGSPTNLRQGSYAPDRYTTNIFLVLTGNQLLP